MYAYVILFAGRCSTAPMAQFVLAAGMLIKMIDLPQRKLN